MEFEAFRMDFLENVRLEAASNLDGSTSSFVTTAMETLLVNDLIPDYQKAFYEGKGKNNRAVRVDAYSEDYLDNTLSLFIADFIGNSEQNILTQIEAIAIFKKATNFVEEVLMNNLKGRLEMSTEAYDLAEIIVSKKEDIRRIRIHLLTDKKMSDRIKNIANDRVLTFESEYRIWDIEKFYRLALVGGEVEELQIDMEEYSEFGLPCLEAVGTANGRVKSYLCVIEGNALADMYDRYGSRLLEGNVRSFLSLKVGVNKKIRETLIRTPEMFFSYNNGISATATGIEFYDDKQLRIKRIQNLQIVNGGQTTATISTTRFKDKISLVGVFVQMKLSVITNDDADEVIPSISRSSNSQNKVSEADFFSNHKYHVRLEQHSSRVTAPPKDGNQHGTHWFYERARGSYNQKQIRLTSGERAKFLLANPKEQVITKTDLAKYICSYQQKPDIVSRGAQTNFINFAEYITAQWDKDESQFHQDYFKWAVALAILFKSTEKLVSKQEWYRNSYRANIVTYTIASLSYKIKMDYPEKHLNYSDIWAQQRISEAMSEQLVILAKLAQDMITDENRPIVNVTQWCKQKACWERFMKTLDEISLNAQFSKTLVGKREKASEENEARKTQKMDNKISAMEAVLSKGYEYWELMGQWARAKKIVDDVEIRCLSAASKMQNGVMPTDVQCKKLLRIEERLLSEGFVVE